MTYFTFAEIINSVLSSLIYGSVFSVLYMTLFIAFGEARALLELPKRAISYEGKLFARPNGRIFTMKPPVGAAMGALTFLSVFLFSVGYILLSYYSLDGCVRIYTLFLSVGAFFITKLAIGKSFLPIIEKLFNIAFCILYFAFRTVVIILKRMLYLLCKKIPKKKVKKRHNTPFCDTYIP